MPGMCLPRKGGWVKIYSGLIHEKSVILPGPTDPSRPCPERVTKGRFLELPIHVMRVAIWLETPTVVSRIAWATWNVRLVFARHNNADQAMIGFLAQCFASRGFLSAGQLSALLG